MKTRRDDGTYNRTYSTEVLVEALTLQIQGYSDDYVCTKLGIHRVYYTRVKKLKYKRDDVWEQLADEVKAFHNNNRKKWDNE